MCIKELAVDQEIMEYDVIIVGAGPSGLAAAIKLKQLAAQQNKTIQVCILEKGAQVGAHIISGAVLEPRSLQALLPEHWQDAPLDTPVTKDKFYYLTEKYALRLPTPSPMKNNGNYIISLGELCQFLAAQAENLGCEIYPGFAATEILYNKAGEVIGVATGELGVDKEGQKTANFQPGMQLHATQTLFAEGCRGQLSQLLMDHFQLRNNAQPQTYGIGIKEVWQIPEHSHKRGLAVHTVGWPLDSATYGGSFIYHLSNNRVALGLVVGLDYKNTWLSPFSEMQRFKTHPFLQKLLSGGERIAYGSRALNEGGWMSLPKLTFPGGALIGDSAGFINVAKIKGIHTAMQSGMYAAEVCYAAILSDQQGQFELTAYTDRIKQSWVAEELYNVRNIRPGFRHGLFIGLANAAFETYITRGKSPWTLCNHADHLALTPSQESPKIHYPKPDGVLTFDRLSSVYLTNTFHEENQPAHLTLRDKNVAIDVNYREYASPETRYCPAAVYEIIEEESGPRLQINAQNCIHCKTCDIKDPRQNIVWKAPEGGGGPNYVSM
jgi:electron-transferring-flavoprotein dehydrogenase